ncbi:MAG: hypothetical protein SVU88_04475 [Candidatus Nanohaloarchaea archaeon]|nr:hypothetical protein [Candidatus Nanohaloarchaea archaeon]
MRRGILVLAAVLLVPAAAAGTPQLSVTTGSGQACPSGSSQYTIQLSNPGPAADTYDISINAPWKNTVTLPADSVRVQPGATERLPLWIQAPVSASPGDHRFRVAATSSNNGKTAAERETLRVLSCRAVDLSVDTKEQAVCRGETATYTVTVENDGAVEETYRLRSDTGTLSRDRITVPADAERTVSLTVSSREAVNRTVTVRAASTSSYASDTATVRFVSEECRGVSVDVAPANASVCRSASLLLTAAATNTGSISDTYTVSIGDDRTNVSLGPGETATIERNIDAARITGDIQVSVESTTLPRVRDSGIAAVDVNRCHDMDLSTVETAPDAANQTLIELALRNNGTERNTYMFALDGPDWMDVQPRNVTLAPGEATPVYVYLAPDFFGDGTYTAALVVEGDGVRETVRMNVTARNGTVTVETASTRTPTGAITVTSPGVIAVLLTALVLFIGGYYIFYRERDSGGETEG